MSREQKMIDAIRKDGCRPNTTKKDRDNYNRMFNILLRIICRREHFKTAINVYVYDEAVEVIFPIGGNDVIRD